MNEFVRGVTAQRYAESYLKGYRPDLDGLRALAVLSVVIFHAFPALLPGGFIGVDVFFVLSGYLITGLILRERDEGRFTLRRFYARRARRIFPALMLILALGWIVGWLALSSNELSKYGKYMAGGAAFAVNFMFRRDAGYFDSQPDTKPLLHLWSLSVEEQFYLLWPLFIAASFRLFGRLGPALILSLLASLGYCLWKTPIDPVGAFYLPLTRFWEMLAGAALVLWERWRSPSIVWRQRPAWAGTLALAGLVLLVIGWSLIHSKRQFPGAWASLPVISAVLLIAAGQHPGWHQRLLQHNTLVWVGLISYPLYLWHWPLLSFARVLDGHTPSEGKRLILVAVSFVLAALTHRFIERPIRFGPTSKWRMTALFLGMVVLISLGHWVSRGHGMKWRYEGRLLADLSTMEVGADRERLRVKSCGLEPSESKALTYCMQDRKEVNPEFIALGDSKAEALVYGLSRESGPHRAWMMIGPTNFLRPLPANEIALARIERDPAVKVVLLSNALRVMMPVEADTGRVLQAPTEEEVQAWLKAYSAIFERLHRSGRHVVFVLDNPTLPDPNDCISGRMSDWPLLAPLLYRKPNPLCTQRYSDHLKWTAPYYEFSRRLQTENPDVLVYNPVPLLCDTDSDSCPIAREGQFLYSYGDHLSDIANSLIARDLLPRIRDRWSLTER